MPVMVNRPFLLFLRLRRSQYPMLKQRDLKIVDTTTKLLVVYRLQNIIRDLQPKCLPAIGKIVITGYYHKSGIGVLDAGELDNL